MNALRRRRGARRASACAISARSSRRASRRRRCRADAATQRALPAASNGRERGSAPGCAEGRAAPAAAGLRRSAGSAYARVRRAGAGPLYRIPPPLARLSSEGVADVVTLNHEMETLHPRDADLLRAREPSAAPTSRIACSRRGWCRCSRWCRASIAPRVPRRSPRAKRSSSSSRAPRPRLTARSSRRSKAPLLHLVRNAVNHGIEPPEEREARRQAARGQIIVSAAYEGNQVVISVRDDGAGIDPERIRADRRRARPDRRHANAHRQRGDQPDLPARRLPPPRRSPRRAGAASGWMSCATWSRALRGRSRWIRGRARGRIFTMKFPISLQIARAVLVQGRHADARHPDGRRGADRPAGLLSACPGATPAIEVRGERYPLAHLANYLKLAPGRVDERSSVLLVNAGKRRIALLVDAHRQPAGDCAKPLGAAPARRARCRGGDGAGQRPGRADSGTARAARAAAARRFPAAGSSGAALPMPASSQSRSARCDDRPVAHEPLRHASGRIRRLRLQPLLAATPQREFVVPPHRPTRHARSRLPASAQLVRAGGGRQPQRAAGCQQHAQSAGWEVQTARDGVEALDVIARERPPLCCWISRCRAWMATS